MAPSATAAVLAVPHIPAWKRLGLRLKFAQEEASIIPHDGPQHAREAAKKKRKRISEVNEASNHTKIDPKKHTKKVEVPRRPAHVKARSTIVDISPPNLPETTREKHKHGSTAGVVREHSLVTSKAKRKRLDHPKSLSPDNHKSEKDTPNILVVSETTDLAKSVLPKSHNSSSSPSHVTDVEAQILRSAKTGQVTASDLTSPVASTSEKRRRKREGAELLAPLHPMSPPTKALPATSSTHSNETAPAEPAKPPKRKKSVTFTPETKIQDATSIRELLSDWNSEQSEEDLASERSNTNSKGKKPKRQKTRKDKQASGPNTIQDTVTIEHPALQYLTEFHTRRESWKFNKNKQNYILKHLLDLELIPVAYESALFEYIKSLQGKFARERIQEFVDKVRAEDKKAFQPTEEAMEESEEDRRLFMEETERRKKNYDNALEHYLSAVHEKNAELIAAVERKYKLTSEDDAKKLRRRKRAEVLLWGMKSAKKGISRPVQSHLDNGPVQPPQKRMKLNDGSAEITINEDEVENHSSQGNPELTGHNSGSAQRMPRKRKIRTGEFGDSEGNKDSPFAISSSESSSSSDSDSESEEGEEDQSDAGVSSHNSTSEDAGSESSSSSDDESDESDESESESDGSSGVSSMNLVGN